MAAIPGLQILLPDPPPTPHTRAPSHPSRPEPPGSAPAEDPGPAPPLGKVTETRASVSQPARETKFLVAELVPGPWRDHDAVSPPPARAPTRPTAALGAPLLGHLLVPRPGESRESHPCRSPSRPASAARRTPHPARSSRDRRRTAAAPPCRPRSPLRPSCCARARPRRVGGAGRTQQRPCQRRDRETRSPGGRARWALAREPIEAAGRGLWRCTALRGGRARASQVKQSTEGAVLDPQTRTACGRRLGRQPCRVWGRSGRLGHPPEPSPPRFPASHRFP